VSRHPDVELFETRLQAFFEILKKRQTLGGVGHIDEDSGQIVTIGAALMPPESLDGLGFGGDSAKPLLKFKERNGDQVAGDLLPIVKPQRQEDFEPPERAGP